ncbi:MAG TPA: SDR family NAD(P)-dependent oxidoreductase [Chloroflexota bacterium]|jgi:short-subunit dehydrogenase
MQIADRVFIVTGASSGIGAAVGRALAEGGGRVALVARRVERLEELAGQLGPSSLAIPIDLTTAEAPEHVHAATLEAFGAVHGLVNCAGRGLAGDLLELDLDSLDEALELNLVAPLRLIQRVAPRLVEQEEGVIVNVSSPTARMGLPGIAGYAISKSALDALTAALRRELFGTGVRVIAVYPGVTESEFYQHIMGEDDGDGARPPGRPASAVAAAIVRGILRNQREVWTLSGAERNRLRLMTMMGRVAPTALDRGLSPRR